MFYEQLKADLDLVSGAFHGQVLPKERSKHYLSFVRNSPCIGCALLEVNQTTPTTVHHIRPRGIGKKCPDFLTIPVEDKRHMHGPFSIDKMGKKEWLEHHGAEDYRALALIMLHHYIDRGWKRGYLLGSKVVEHKEGDRGAAIYYSKKLIQELTPA